MDQRVNDNETRHDTAELPASIAELRALVLEQKKQLEQQSLFIDQLLEQIRLARHQHFGVRSECFSIDQLALAFNEAEAAAELSDDPDGEHNPTSSAPWPCRRIAAPRAANGRCRRRFPESRSSTRSMMATASAASARQH